MRLLITGIAGFIASRIARKALALGHQVIGVDDLSMGKLSNIPEGCTFHHFDLSIKENLQQLDNRVDVILHLAGQSSGEISFDDPVADLQKNTISTLNLIEFGIKNNVRKLIYASSMSVYGAVADSAVSELIACTPLSCYGTGKVAAENYLRIYQEQLPYISFRMFNVYGPGQDLENLRQGMVSIFVANAITKGHVLVKGSLERYRDFIYIDDVVDVWIEAISNDKGNNNVFNLGSGRRTSIQEMLECLKICLPQIDWTAKGNTPGDQFGIYADTNKLDTYFKHKVAIDLNTGLNDFVSWAKRHIHESITV